MLKRVNKNNMKKKTRRGRGRRRNDEKRNFVIIGSNAAGLKQKKVCLASKILKFQPGCVFIQETKVY